MEDFVTPNKFFKYPEFIVSTQFPEIASQMVLSEKNKERYLLWVESCGDPWRLAHPDIPIYTLSGHRTFALNKLVGGSDDSDHMQSCALDVTTGGKMDATDFFMSIVCMGLPYRQLLCYVKQNFVHWSWNVPGRHFKQETKIIYA